MKKCERKALVDETEDTVDYLIQFLAIAYNLEEYIIDRLEV